MKRLFYWLGTLGRPILFYGCLRIASLCKMSYMVGSHMAFFSAANILYPLGGLFLGVSDSCLWFVISSFGRLILGVPLYLHLIHGIPGFCAALYMASSHSVIRLFLPLACMILFIVHPVGFQAVPYAFYWLIPIALYFTKKKITVCQCAWCHICCTCGRIGFLALSGSNAGSLLVGIDTSCCC